MGTITIRSVLCVCILFNALIVTSIYSVCLQAALGGARSSPIGSIPTYSTYGFSSDGEWLAYILRPPSMEAQSSREGVKSWVGQAYFGDIWVFNLRTGEQRNVSEGLGPSWFPKWSPHGNLLAFLANRTAEGDSSLWIWDSSTGEGRQISNARIQAGGGIPLEWAPSGRSVFATSIPVGLSLGPPPKHAQRRSDRENDEKIWSESLHDPRQLRDLLQIDIDSGKSTTLAHHQIIATHVVSPDGSLMAYTVPRQHDKGSLFFDLAIVNLANLHRKVLARRIPLNNTDGHFAWSPDSKSLAYRRSEVLYGTGHDVEQGREIAMRDDCFVLDVKHPVPRNVSHLPTPQLFTVGFSKQCWWDRGGKQLYFVFNGALWQASVSNKTSRCVSEIPDHHLIWPSFPETPEVLEFLDGGRSVLAMAKSNNSNKKDLYKIDLQTGESTQVLAAFAAGEKQRHMYDPYAISASENRVAYVTEDDVHGPDLWVTDADFKIPRRVTQLMPHAPDERQQN